jgi:hypothetical protein
MVLCGNSFRFSSRQIPLNPKRLLVDLLVGFWYFHLANSFVFKAEKMIRQFTKNRKGARRENIVFA